MSAVTALNQPDDLVDSWLTIPDVADALGVDAGRVRRLLKEGRIAGVRRGDPPVLSIPADFLVPVDAANPTADERDVGGAHTVLASLQGTLTVLGDAGFDYGEMIAWLFTANEALPGRPIDVLRSGSKTAVRRLAQAEL